MGEKRYLKWYNKLGYGSGDLAGNMVYAFLSSFVMLYLTNTVGLNPGIIGTLIMVSKLFDGVSDIFFGTMIDKTKSKLGKARPWMLYAYIGCAVTLVANFAIPASLGRTAQYAWFFIAYTMLNAVFFTANNIAYASLVTFCTRNSKERVEMGSFRFIFAFSTSLIIQSVTVQFVRALGNGASAWKTVAIIYAVIGLIVNTISVFSWAINIPVIIAMCITPMLVERMKGLYRMNLAGYILGTAGRVGVIIAGYMGSVPLMIAFTAVAALGMAPWQGDMGAVVASCSEYTWLTKGKHIDGTMYSCTSFGTKIGGGIGVALCGWLLDISGFVKTSAVQPTSCINMLHVMYLWIPMLLSLCITFIMSRMNVEGANEKLRAQMESVE